MHAAWSCLISCSVQVFETHRECAIRVQACCKGVTHLLTERIKGNSFLPLSYPPFSFFFKDTFYLVATTPLVIISSSLSCITVTVATAPIVRGRPTANTWKILRLTTCATNAISTSQPGMTYRITGFKNCTILIADFVTSTSMMMMDSKITTTRPISDVGHATSSSRIRMASTSIIDNLLDTFIVPIASVCFNQQVIFDQ